VKSITIWRRIWNYWVEEKWGGRIDPTNPGAGARQSGSAKGGGWIAFTTKTKSHAPEQLDFGHAGIVSG
jgi:hypothetical protein